MVTASELLQTSGAEITAGKWPWQRLAPARFWRLEFAGVYALVVTTLAPPARRRRDAQAHAALTSLNGCAEMLKKLSELCAPKSSRGNLM